MRIFLKRVAVPLVFSVTLPASLVLTERAPRAVTPCAGLVGLSLVDGAVTSAAEITAPFTTTASSGPALITVSAPFPFCKVTATLSPTSDSAIDMEIWMPAAANWNHKFLGVGNGALTGAIWHTSMVRPLQAGYAVANSTSGTRCPPRTGRSAIPRKWSTTRTAATTSRPWRARRSSRRSMVSVRSARTFTAARTAAIRR